MSKHQLQHSLQAAVSSVDPPRARKQTLSVGTTASILAWGGMAISLLIWAALKSQGWPRPEIIRSLFGDIILVVLSGFLTSLVIKRVRQSQTIR